MTTEMKLVLETCHRLEQEIAARPRPKAWEKWLIADDADDREHGPVYLPSAWFGDGRTVPEKFRVRYLRAIVQATDAGLVTPFFSGRRLRRLKLTDDGRMAIGAERPAKTRRARAGGLLAASDAPTASIHTPASDAPETQNSAIVEGDE